MKTVKTSMVLLALVCYHLGVAQKFSETISKELSFATKSDKNMLVVKNINGPISVEGYEGSSIKLEADKTISARRDTYLEKGKQEFKLR